MHYGSVQTELGELLRRYHDTGDESAIEEIVRRTRPRLLRIAARIGAAQDAEDAVQSAYLALARKRGETFDAPVLPWLVTTVVRIAYRRKALASREQHLADRLARDRSDNASPLSSSRNATPASTGRGSPSSATASCITVVRAMRFAATSISSRPRCCATSRFAAGRSTCGRSIARCASATSHWTRSTI